MLTAVSASASSAKVACRMTGCIGGSLAGAGGAGAEVAGGPVRGAPVAVGQPGAGSEELLAQRARLVLLGVDPAPLQFGHQMVDDVHEGRRAHGKGDVEAVDVGLLRPLLQLIRHLG